MKFLRLNINTDYNFKMNAVDEADQLRNSYRPDKLWMHKRKWWWCFGVLLVNCYICYVQFNLLYGKKKKDRLTH